MELDRYLYTAGAGAGWSMLLRVCVLAINKSQEVEVVVVNGEFITILHSELAEEE